MRQIFIPTDIAEKIIEGSVDHMTQVAIKIAKAEKLVNEKAPWASRWIYVQDGIKAFESITDYKTWMNQK